MNKNLTKRAFSILILVIVLSSVVVAPVMASTTYTIHAFGWSNDVVNGLANGRTYALHRGTATLKTIGTVTEAPDYYADNIQYTVILKKDNKLWFDTVVGTVTQTATRYGRSNYASWNIPSDGVYYLYFQKSQASRGIVTLDVQGTLTN